MAMRSLPADWTKSEAPSLVKVPRAAFLAIDGAGEPGGAEFSAAVRAIYATAYALKFMASAHEQDFAVGALEGLWEVEGGPRRRPQKPRTAWRWKLLIRVPDGIPARLVADAREKAGARVKEAVRVKLERIAEGRCVQALHVGPYAEEPRTIERLESFARRKGLELVGPHHEIYLSDPRRTAPERVKTIVRHAVR